MKLVKDSERSIHPSGNPDVIRNQMSLISDTDEILKFLEMAGKKSILNEHTVSCRITACHNLFSILNSGEDNVNYMLQNLDLLVNRFRNKNSSVQASTLKVYKSRLKSTLEDFVAWNKNAVDWERSVIAKADQFKKDKSAKAAANAAAAAAAAAASAAAVATETAPAPASEEKKAPRANHRTQTVTSALTRPTDSGAQRKVSFPIRSDFNVEITLHGDGLSSKELLKLGLFLFPYCKDMESREESVWSGISSQPN